jgi:hypothetical protein
MLAVIRLVIAVVLVVAGCGGHPDAPETAPAAEDHEKETAEALKQVEVVEQAIRDLDEKMAAAPAAEQSAMYTERLRLQVQLRDAQRASRRYRRPISKECAANPLAKGCS